MYNLVKCEKSFLVTSPFFSLPHLFANCSDAIIAPWYLISQKQKKTNNNNNNNNSNNNTKWQKEVNKTETETETNHEQANYMPCQTSGQETDWPEKQSLAWPTEMMEIPESAIRNGLRESRTSGPGTDRFGCAWLARRILNLLEESTGKITKKWCCNFTLPCSIAARVLDAFRTIFLCEKEQNRAEGICIGIP